MTKRKNRKRDLNDLKRRAAYKKARKVVLIVCEGKKTEPQYFISLRQKLRMSNVEVEIIGKECDSAPITVVDHAIDLKEKAGKSSIRDNYDEIWCVMDVEAPQPHESLKRAIQKANSNGLSVILSNPCFEYWFLLHFKRTSAQFLSNAKVRKALQVKKYLPDYEKNDSGVFAKIYPKTATAISNANAVINEKHYGEDLSGCNPSTHVFRIVEQLHEIAEKAIPNE